MTREERIRGAVLAAAIGDALGAPAEFMDADAIRREYGVLRDLAGGGIWEPGETTDDSALMLAVAEAYGAGGYDLHRAGRAMVEWATGPVKDIGNQTAGALRLIRSGEATPRSAGRLYDQRHPGGAGNGSLMRCAPTGLVRRTDDTRLVTEAIELSAITHADPRCTGSCVAMCAALARLVEGADVEGALQEAGRLARPVCLDVADLVEGVLSRGAPRYQREPIGYVLLSLERALIALRDATDLEPALVEVVNMGGDSDTNGCIAGALLGARCGADATPQRWLDGLQDCERFEAVARELAEFA